MMSILLFCICILTHMCVCVRILKNFKSSTFQVLLSFFDCILSVSTNYCAKYFPCTFIYRCFR